MELPPEEFHRSKPLFGRARQPIAKRRPIAALFVEGRQAHDALQTELHRFWASV
jgi:hypothetical protein